MAKSLEQFKNETLGGSYGNPGTGTYKGQCVSYVRQYIEQCFDLATKPIGNAVSYYDSPFTALYFDKVTDGSRKDGDILCWGDDSGNWTGPEGHVAISYGGKILNQNYGSSLKVSINNFFAPGYQGALRRKGNQNVAIIQNADNWRGRANRSFITIRGRAMGPGEFEPWVGQDFLHLVEALQDNPEADANVDYASWGRTAKNDNWVGQIEGLQAQTNALTAENKQLTNDLATANTTIDNLQGQLVIANAQIEELKKQLLATGSDTIHLNALGELLQWFVVRVGLKK